HYTGQDALHGRGGFRRPARTAERDSAGRRRRRQRLPRVRATTAPPEATRVAAVRVVTALLTRRGCLRGADAHTAAIRAAITGSARGHPGGDHGTGTAADRAVITYPTRQRPAS